MPEPAQKDDLTEYKFQQLFQGLERLGAEMRDGFAEIKRLLDSRLESRDKDIKEIDDRVSNLENWRNIREGRDQVLGRILLWVGGGFFSALSGVFYLVLTQ